MSVRAGRNYLDLIAGLTRASRERARAVLAAAGLEEAALGAGERAAKVAEEILQAGRANRELVEGLVSEEVARVADRWGFVRSAELEELRREVDVLRVALVRTTVNTPPTAEEGLDEPEGDREAAS